MSSDNWFLRIAAAIALACASATLTFAETVVVEPKGEYAKIDTGLTKEAIEALSKGSTAERRKAIANIQARPDTYAPPALYALSHALFQDGMKDDGAFWFYAGQLRVTPTENEGVQRFRRMEETEDGNGTDTEGGLHA